MDWNDENSSAMMKPSNLRGANRDRKPLRDKNEFVGAPPLPPGDNKKVYPCFSILKETAVRRPTTRQFSALLANQRNGPQGLNQCHEDKENIHRPIDLNVPTNIEIMDVESDMEIDPCSHAIRYTEAILNEDNCDKEKNHGDGEVDEDIDGSMDIDQLDFGNPLAVVDYVEEIYDFYRQTERSCCPSYMSHQPDINERMRAILVDWLIEVHYKFKLMDETLFRTVSIIDRFLQCQAVTRKQLQLVGITALLVACKYEEVYVPVIDDFIMISDNAYTREQILEMEKLIINKLEFSFSEPTAYVFMRRFLKAAQSEKELEYLSFYLIELSLIEYEMLKYKPSMLAAAAIYTAQCILKGFRCWSRASEHHTYYSERDLIDSARMMVDLQKAADLGKLTGAYRKYNTPKFGFASRTIPASFLLDALF